MYRTTSYCLLVCFCSYALAHSYAPFPTYGNSVHVGPNSGEAAAAAYTNTASSAAVATQLTAADYENLEKLAHEDRQPFLTGPNVPFSPLDSAFFPKRAQVIQTPAGFYKTHDGKIQFSSGGTLAFVAI